MKLAVSIIRRDGVDICEGQVLARCCLEDMCADVPLDASIEPGLYELEKALENPALRICVEILTRQRERGIKALKVCKPKEADKCVKKLVEHVLSKYGGPVLIFGFNKRVAGDLFSFTYGYVADMGGQLEPYDFVDATDPYQLLDEVKAVVVAPGALHYVNVVELVRRAKELGKPVIMYGALSAVYKDLGIEYFCPYGLKIR